MRLLIVAFSVTLLATTEYPAAAAQKPSTAKKTSRRRTSKSSKKPAAPASARRSTQQQPTADRYKEIQQALAGKGYFNGPVDGNWGPGSVEALKRFQHDQNLTDDGKIGALSLIALGLGPQRTARAETAPEKIEQP